MAFTLTSHHGDAATPAFGAGVATGNVFVVAAYNGTNATETVTSFTDTVGTSYSKTSFGAAGASFMLAWGLLGGTASNTGTITWSGGSTSAVLWAEFGGSSVAAATQDGTTKTAGASSGTSTTTPSITTTGADDLLISVVFSFQSTTTMGGSWLAAVTDSFVGTLGYQLDVGAGAYSANATFTSSGWASLLLAIQAGSSFIESTPLIVDQARVRASFY